MRSATGRLAILGVCCWGLCLSQSSAAAEINANTVIDQVTVYTQGAMVTRSGRVALPAGAHRLVVKGLPEDINADLLRVAIAAAGVRMGSVEVTDINQGQFVAARERELRAQIEAKSDQRTLLQDEIDTATTQLKLLESLAANPTGGNTGAGLVNSTNLPVVLTTVGNQVAQARARSRDAKLKQRALDREIETLKAELSKVATNSKVSKDVAVTIDVPAAVMAATITVTYLVEDASWRWVYQARLDTTRNQLSLERQGKVQQASGEDWNGVALTLTTARPTPSVATPDLSPLFVDLLVPQPVMTMAAPRALMKSAADGAVMEEIQVTDSEATTVATQYLVEYQVPGRVSVTADSEERLYPIGSEVFATQLVARVVPAQSRSAHLEALFEYQRDVPIEAGELQLFRDGAFVGVANTPAFLPGAQVRMPFGVDERIKVQVQDEASKSDQSNWLGKQISKETRQRFDITNYHAATMPIEVLDRIPVSRNADVRVEVLKGGSEPSQRDVDGKAGVWLWRINAEPNKTASIRQYYVVRYPKDRQLQMTAE